MFHYTEDGIEIQLDPYGYPTDSTPLIKDVYYCDMAGTAWAVHLTFLLKAHLAYGPLLSPFFRGEDWAQEPRDLAAAQVVLTQQSRIQIQTDPTVRLF